MVICRQVTVNPMEFIRLQIQEQRALLMVCPVSDLHDGLKTEVERLSLYLCIAHSQSLSQFSSCTK